MKLTKKDRLMLWNQYEILKLLDQENAEDYENYQEILLQGFEYDYDSLVSGMDDIPKDVSEEVYDILQMFRCLAFSFERLDDTAELTKEDVMFEGFDGNEEIPHYIYAKWLIRDNGKYEELSKCDFNSHWRKLDKYREMLERFNEVISKKGYSRFTDSLSLNELIYIVDK